MDSVTLVKLVDAAPLLIKLLAVVFNGAVVSGKTVDTGVADT